MAWLFGHLKLWLYGLGVGLLAVAVIAIRQSGADAEKLKQVKADAKAASTIGQKRAEARSASDIELNRKVDEWSRK